MRLVSAKFLGCVLALLVLAVATQPAEAGYIVSFTRQTSNSAENVAGQLRVSIEDQGGSNVRFVFRNIGTVESSVSEIYFDDGSLMNPTAATFNFSGSGSGVNFTQGANPSDPPSIPSFNTSVVLSSDAVGNPSEGINQAAATSTTEFLNYNFTLSNSQTFADVIASLNKAATGPGGWNVDQPGGLRIAMHLRSIGSRGNSDTFLSTGFVYDPNTPGGFVGFPNTDAVPAPAPASLVLLGSAMPFAFGLRRWLNRRVVAA